jgi:glycosyltransferase involved in cell wall biosynthesis
MKDARHNRSAAANPRVAHCVGFYFPQTVGGTEVYVRDLATALSQYSVDSSIVAATDRAYEAYEWAGTPVFRYPSNWADVRETSEPSSTTGLSKFQEVIARADPDVFHLHSWTTGAGLRQLSQVAQLGIPCVATVHVPSALCLRGTMILNGREPCDGRIDEKRCAQCWAISRGLPSPVAFAVSRLPKMSIGGSHESTLTRRLATMLSARSLVDAQARDLHRMASLCDRIVAPSQWVYAALAANAVPPQKIFISRQAVAETLVERGSTRRAGDRDQELRVGFIGRLEHYKGAHILLEAMGQIPREVPIRLIVAGSGTELPYLRTLEAAAEGDARIEFLGPILHDQLPDFLKRIDVLAVPSNYMETGPLVVLEAYAFGIPVMGANLGGIAERIRDGVDGWLLPFDDNRAWAAAMQAAALDRGQVARLAANIRQVRTMAHVASEMAAQYRQILDDRTAGTVSAAVAGRDAR